MKSMQVFSDYCSRKQKKKHFYLPAFYTVIFHNNILQFLQLHKYNNHCFAHVTWKHRYLLQYEYWGTSYLHSPCPDELSFQYKKMQIKNRRYMYFIHVFFPQEDKNRTKVLIDQSK